jgi:hypothetical protein
VRCDQFFRRCPGYPLNSAHNVMASCIALLRHFGLHPGAPLQSDNPSTAPGPEISLDTLRQEPRGEYMHYLHVLTHPWYLVKSSFTAFAHRRCSLLVGVSMYLLPMTGRIAWWIWVGMSINLQNRLPLKMTRCIVLE